MNDYSNLFVCLMGLGTVFFGLACLIALTTFMGRVLEPYASALKVTPPMPAVPAAARAVPATEPNREELAAAIAAAVAEELGTDITGIRIVSMRRL